MCSPQYFNAPGQLHLYIHCALEGHKLDCIRRNPNVAFTLAADVRIRRKNPPPTTSLYAALAVPCW